MLLHHRSHEVVVQFIPVLALVPLLALEHGLLHVADLPRAAVRDVTYIHSRRCSGNALIFYTCVY